MNTSGISDCKIITEAKAILRANPNISEKQALRLAISELKKSQRLVISEHKKSKQHAAMQRKLQDANFREKHKRNKRSSKAAKKSNKNRIERAEFNRRELGIELPTKKAIMVRGGGVSPR